MFHMGVQMIDLLVIVIKMKEYLKWLVKQWFFYFFIVVFFLTNKELHASLRSATPEIGFASLLAQIVMLVLFIWVFYFTYNKGYKKGLKESKK